MELVDVAILGAVPELRHRQDTSLKVHKLSLARDNNPNPCSSWRDMFVISISILSVLGPLFPSYQFCYMLGSCRYNLLEFEM